MTNDEIPKAEVAAKLSPCCGVLLSAGGDAANEGLYVSIEVHEDARLGLRGKKSWPLVIPLHSDSQPETPMSG